MCYSLAGKRGRGSGGTVADKDEVIASAKAECDGKVVVARGSGIPVAITACNNVQRVLDNVVRDPDNACLAAFTALNDQSLSKVHAVLKGTLNGMGKTAAVAKIFFQADNTALTNAEASISALKERENGAFDISTKVILNAAFFTDGSMDWVKAEKVVDDMIKERVRVLGMQAGHATGYAAGHAAGQVAGAAG